MDTGTGPCKALIPSLEWQEKKVQDFKNIRKFIELKTTARSCMNKTVRNKAALAKFANETPKLSEITLFHANAKVKLLNLMTSHLLKLVQNCMTNNWGVWSYAIMLSMQEPLHRESHCALRELAKECLQIRSTLPEGTRKEIYVPLNLVICIVARIFGQLDLADN